MDTNLLLRDGSADLTDDETLTSVHIGPMLRPMWLHVIVPEVSSADTLDVELEFCANATPTTQVYNMNMPQITAAGHFAIPFFTKLEHLQVKLNTSHSDDLFGAVQVWIDPSGRWTGITDM